MDCLLLWYSSLVGRWFLCSLLKVLSLYLCLRMSYEKASEKGQSRALWGF